MKQLLVTGGLFLELKLRIYVDNPVSVWTVPPFFIGQICFCVDSSVSVYTRGSV